MGGLTLGLLSVVSDPDLCYSSPHYGVTETHVFYTVQVYFL